MEASEVVAALRAAGCVFAEEEAELLLALEDPELLEQGVARRVAGEPLEHVLGWAAFRGLRVVVTPGVFVPRRRTEFLAGLAVVAATPTSIVADLCCGAGAIGAAVLHEVPGVVVYAGDSDPLAVEVASRNLPVVSCGDLFEALPPGLRGRLDVLVANTPYVPSDEVRLLPAEARLHEPRATLDGGHDGLDLLRRIAAEAPRWLAPGGVVLIEISERQVPGATDAFEHAGLTSRIERDDDVGAVVAVGRLGQREVRSS